MTEIEIAIALDADLSGLEEGVQSAAARTGLSITLKGSLVEYPGCVHWHFKSGRERGTLELTFWPERKRLWFKIQDGRRGAWIESAVRDLKGLLEENLRNNGGQ